MGAYANPGVGGVSNRAPANPIDMFPVNSGAGSNQYFGNSYGSMPGNTAAPVSNGGYFNSQPYNPYMPPTQGAPNNVNNPSIGQQSNNPGSENLGHGIIATGQQYPQLGDQLVSYLQGQIGQGLTPFGMSTPLPTGGMTQPGQLTAGMNPLLQQLAQFFQTGNGGSMPGMSQLSNIANNGVSALPEWQSMIQAQQQGIQQGQTNLQGQFASMGDLAGSGFGNAMQNYNQGTQATQNALLGQLQQSNIQNIQMPAIQSMLSGETQMASGLQNLDQSAINAYLQQYQTDQPQNNPLLSMAGSFGSMYPPTTKTPTSMQTFEGLLSSLGGLGGFTTPGGTSIGF